MEVFDFVDAWDYLKEGIVVKRVSWKGQELIAMLFPDGSRKLYKMINWELTDEDREANDWTFAKED